MVFLSIYFFFSSSLLLNTLRSGCNLQVYNAIDGCSLQDARPPTQMSTGFPRTIDERTIANIAIGTYAGRQAASRMDVRASGTSPHGKEDYNLQHGLLVAAKGSLST